MNELHFKEDTSKPENRTNLTLFHLLMISEINSFIKFRLNLHESSLIFPCPNLSFEEFDISGRPDFKIMLNGEIVGFIEVELGKEDEEQINRYRKSEKRKIYSIVGKKSYPNADLSLEEIYEYIKTIKQKYEGSQVIASIELFNKLIEYYIIEGNFSINSKATSVSEKMKSTSLMRSFYSEFGQNNIIDFGPAMPGKVLFNTIGENGFSLRIYCNKSSSKSLSILNRSGGREFISFTSVKKLSHYLPLKKKEVDELAELLNKLAIPTNIYLIDEKSFLKIPIQIVEQNVIDIVSKIKKLV